MASSYRLSTPPPPSSARTPSTPRLGFDDNYEPYSPRKTTRAQRSRAAHTPPPQSSFNTRSSSRSKVSPTSMSSSPSSPPTASKKRAPANSLTMGGRRVSGSLDFESTASAAASLGLPAPKQPKIVKSTATASMRNTGTLITPAKTPQKAPTQTAPAISAIARNLFPVRGEEAVMPSPKKHKARRTYGLDSFEIAEDAPIQIFTDSMDRVPEVDMSDENPFFGVATRAESEISTRSSKRRKLNVPGEGERTVEELEQREDGLIYVFRGKKMFRKFVDIDDEGSFAEGDNEDEANAQLEDIVPRALHRPLTRSSIKPRLLFPSAEQTRAKQSRTHTTDDEEADTDIEETHLSCTPMDQMDEIISTPKAPRFGPVSPPTTTRATRSKKVDMSSSPAEPTSDDDEPMLRGRRSGGKISPFDSWQRVKKPAATKKREGDTLSRRGGDKRLRA